MAVHSGSVGRRGGLVTDRVDDRWLSNYAASVGDVNDCYFENRHGSPAVHPAYVSHLEWDAIGALYEHLDIPEEDLARGMHSLNHTELLAPFASGDLLESSAVLVGVEQRRSGARLTNQIDTFVDGVQVARSFTQTIFRDVSVIGDDEVPNMPDTQPQQPDEFTREEQIRFDKLAPYVFSECARDYGAIHTDRKVAESVGIPGLIMHGTGTFAYVLSAIVNSAAEGDPRRVTGFSGKLAAVVFCPSTAVLRTAPFADGVLFELCNEEGDPAITHGVVRLK